MTGIFTFNLAILQKNFSKKKRKKKQRLWVIFGILKYKFVKQKPQQFHTISDNFG